MWKHKSRHGYNKEDVDIYENPEANYKVLSGKRKGQKKKNMLAQDIIDSMI